MSSVVSFFNTKKESSTLFHKVLCFKTAKSAKYFLLAGWHKCFNEDI